MQIAIATHIKNIAPNANNVFTGSVILLPRLLLASLLVTDRCESLSDCRGYNGRNRQTSDQCGESSFLPVDYLPGSKTYR